MSYQSHDPNAPDIWCSTCQDTQRVTCPHEDADDCLLADKEPCPTGKRIAWIGCTVPCPDCPRCRCGAVLTERNVEAHAACNAGVQ